MTLAGHMTKLQAVNGMLKAIGERRVDSLESGHPDAASAEETLDRVNREVQLLGWECNTQRDYVLSINNDSQFAVPDNTLKVDTTNPSGWRKTTTPPYSAHINVSMRRSNDDTRWILWDMDNNSETWTAPTTLCVKLVQYLEFANLTPALQTYVYRLAGHAFQTEEMGSGTLFEFTQQKVSEAKAGAEAEDAENADLNMFKNNIDSARIVYRNNPWYSR